MAASAPSHLFEISKLLGRIKTAPRTPIPSNTESHMIVFLDFEASSLSKNSYPVEVAWVFEDGRSRSFLIRPAPGWTDWSGEAEAVHGISREQLVNEGVEVTVIVDEMVRTLFGQDLYASAPSWDGKWLSTLLRAAGHPRHELRLRKSDEALGHVARTAFGPAISDETITTMVNDVVARSEPTKRTHRALPDACLELKRLRLMHVETGLLLHQDQTKNEDNMPGTFSTVYVVAFDLDERDQAIKAFTARVATSEAAAVDEARDLAGRHAGAVVWKREGNPVVGEEGEPEVIFSVGRVGDFD